MVYTVNPILQMRTSRHREVKALVQDNTVSENAGIWTGSLTPRKMLLATTHQHTGFPGHSFQSKDIKAGDQGLGKTAIHCRCSINARLLHECINKEWKNESNLTCDLCEWRKAEAFWEFWTEGAIQLPEWQIGKGVTEAQKKLMRRYV